ncbi:ABC transporter permease [Halanaerobiaceae bacterium Z-7014]|uniref:ABC transporter permease n=1 Tax=Halonatronomonas betaini TaxID=2778430 RepID=A0A931AYZ5_9FIRM|nr:nickel transporter permease [Halonatronomonas betaini]MBF8437378.1 ABC transporter permease [Halonatronomonas betaini]
MANNTASARVIRQLKNNTRVKISLGLIILIIGVAIFAPIISPYDPNEINLGATLQPPSSQHLLGTDRMGRDILTRIIYGTRISLLVGIIAVGISGLLGVIFGTLAGYYGGYVDGIIMRIVDVLLAFPSILLAIALVAVLGASLFNIMLAIGIVNWVGYARVVRGEFLSLKNKEFVSAAKAMGANTFRIIFKHMLPNCIAPIIVMATLGMAGAIITESSLSFLGLGVQPPTPSWGEMLNTGRQIIRQAWWVSTFPGIAIMLAVLSFNILGDGLRDALDPNMVD